jgi:hypothetical protein
MQINLYYITIVKIQIIIMRLVISLETKRAEYK